ncbi:MAG TPA: hypothetical protein VF223_21555 [Trebonia sp.]
MDRNRYVDLLRILAIGGVVYGHWPLVSITYAHIPLARRLLAPCASPLLFPRGLPAG